MTYEEMVNYLRQVKGCIQTLNFPEVRGKASQMEQQIEKLNNCSLSEQLLNNFYIISFKPFKNEVDEIIKNF